MTGSSASRAVRLPVGAKVYDVVVVGGGLAGFAAARACATVGLSTLLVERRPVLGWESTWAFDLGIGGDASETSSAIAAAVDVAGGVRSGRLDAPILEMVLDRELARSGAGLLYYSQPVGVALHDHVMRELIVGGKSGELRIRARCFIDATANAIVWQLAGGEARARASRGRSRAFVNGLATPPTVRELGDFAGVSNVTIEPGVWPGEVAVSYELEHCDPLVHVRCLPRLLAALREAVAGLDESVVTHLSVEPFPIGPVVDVVNELDGHHPTVANLFWAPGLSDLPADSARTFGGALAAGERAGARIAADFNGVASPSRGPAVIEVVATSAPVGEADVLVCGGGTGGAMAAIAARREGAQVTLLEASPLVGGIGVGGGIHIQYMGVPGGLQDEVDERIRKITGVFGPSSRVRGFHPVAKRVVLAEMLAETGVQVDLNTVVSGALTAESRAGRRRRLTGVVAATPTGRRTFSARVVVDSTGDGDVAALAGQPFTFGREKDGLPHAFSLGAGRADVDRGYTLMMTNADAGYCDPGDVEDLTRARRSSLAHLWQERFTAEDRKYYIAPLIGIRSSRQIQGQTTVTLGELVESATFTDVIGYAHAHLDNHADDYENESDEAMVWMWLLGYHWREIGSEIPYGALVPSEIDGLIVGCRALSVSHDAHTTIRMQRDIQRVGEAAGLAAAISVRRGVDPRDVPIDELQAGLLASGALGPGARAGDSTGTASAVHLRADPALRFPERTIEAWVAALEGPDPREAVWPLYRAGRDSIPLLVEAARERDPAVAFWASVVLAMLGETSAVPALISAVAGRRQERLEAVKSAPVWWGAVILLGRTRSREAVHTLVALIDDRSIGHDVLVAALRALGRIGDPGAAPAIERTLQRDDLPTTRMLQVSHVPLRKQGHNRAPGVVEDGRWAIDLAAAEALAVMGVPRPDLVDRHIRDDRAYVRRYAERVDLLALRTDAAGHAREESRV